jgi:hypothetical protein
MNNQIPRVVRFKNNGITVEICHGEIPDVFRELWFSPVIEMELPDAKVSYEEGSDEDFQGWLRYYRSIHELNLYHTRRALEISKCS